MPDVNCLFLASVNIKSSRDGSNAYYQLKLEGKHSGSNLDCLRGGVGSGRELINFYDSPLLLLLFLPAQRWPSPPLGVRQVHSGELT